MSGEGIFYLIFAIAVGIAVLYANVKDLRKFREQFARLPHAGSFHLYNFSKGFQALYILLVIVCAVITVISGMKADYITGAIALLSACFFSGQFLLCEKNFRFYYDNNGFFYKGTYVAYKSISDIQEMRHVPFAFLKVTTYNGKECRVSKGCMKIIDQQLEQYKKAKKQRKMK